MNQEGPDSGPGPSLEGSPLHLKNELALAFLHAVHGPLGPCLGAILSHHFHASLSQAQIGLNSGVTKWLTNIVNAEVEITATNRASVKIRRSIRAIICAALATVRRRRKRTRPRPGPTTRCLDARTSPRDAARGRTLASKVASVTVRVDNAGTARCRRRARLRASAAAPAPNSAMRSSAS
jgi:hypothetical protein